MNSSEMVAKPLVRVAFRNGLTFQSDARAVLASIWQEFTFVESDQHPQLEIFGPYGGSTPRSKKNRRNVAVSYLCENYAPDLSDYDWVFGVAYEEDVSSDKYSRIEWHGVDPEEILHASGSAMARLDGAKFCNFIYSHRVPYREKFFLALSKYKRIDAPGASMRNCPPIDDERGGKWAAKRNYQKNYKFSISFENAFASGYHTEKIYDPMLAGSVPIYLGNPFVGRHFKEKSFVHAWPLVTARCGERGTARLFDALRPDYVWAQRAANRGVLGRARRKLDGVLRNAVPHALFDQSFDQLIERVVELDRNDSKYLQMASTPWLADGWRTSWEKLRNSWRHVVRLALEGVGARTAP